MVDLWRWINWNGGKRLYIQSVIAFCSDTGHMQTHAFQIGDNLHQTISVTEWIAVCLSWPWWWWGWCGDRDVNSNQTKRRTKLNVLAVFITIISHCFTHSQTFVAGN